jgi:hypothetical protein
VQYLIRNSCKFLLQLLYLLSKHTLYTFSFEEIACYIKGNLTKDEQDLITIKLVTNHTEIWAGQDQLLHISICYSVSSYLHQASYAMHKIQYNMNCLVYVVKNLHMHFHIFLCM